MEVVFTQHLKKIIKATGIISIRHKVEFYSLISFLNEFGNSKLFELYLIFYCHHHGTNTATEVVFYFCHHGSTAALPADDLVD